MPHPKPLPPRVLITNDDGVDSLFLRALVEAHTPHFRVTIAAPLREQSWVGRAFSRLRDVAVESRGELYGAVAAWALDGTPSDCVNIALGNLLPETDHPAAVISGINIGYNITMPLSLSSGTLAGAIEGASWGLPALAFSLELPDDEYLFAQRNHGAISGIGRESLFHAAARAAQFTRAEIAQQPSASGMCVRNVNFPRITSPGTPAEETVPANVRLGKLYQESAPNAFRFKWVKREPNPKEAPQSDMAALRRGNISNCLMRF
jgi:5'-nucleotidase